MSATEEVVNEQQSERDKVESWRLHVLIEAKYPLRLARRLATSDEVDLHRAVELIQSGCQPTTAAEILL